MENNIIGWAALTEDELLHPFNTEAEAAEHGIPVPIVHVEEVKA